jgi:3-hydroxy-9,10-secoandrosta-1,3,5(10)-triene-9,17-dione monooxygenase
VIQPPEPGLTPDQMLARARALRPLLLASQGRCEAEGRVPQDVNDELVKAGFYRIVQPRRFGGYEFDVPTFYRVMMEVARGCPETGWVLALTAGHPLLLASYPEQAQVEAYGPDGEFRGPASFSPPGQAKEVEGGYLVTGAWVSASGIDIGTHFIGMAMVAPDQDGGRPSPIQLMLERDQFEIVDDWKVMGMQGTGSKQVRVKDVFVPRHRTVPTMGAVRGSQAIPAARLYDNPMYQGRIQPFLIGEATAVAVGAARGALDLYEQALKGKRSMFPPFLERREDPEFQAHYGRALALIATAEAALVRAGEDFMAYAAEAAAGGEPFGEERELGLTLVEQQCVRLAWEAMELIFRTAGTSASARSGASIGRIFRNMAVINTHPALQLDRTAVAAAKARFKPAEDESAPTS